MRRPASAERPPTAKPATTSERSATAHASPAGPWPYWQRSRQCFGRNASRSSRDIASKEHKS